MRIGYFVTRRKLTVVQVGKTSVQESMNLILKYGNFWFFLMLFVECNIVYVHVHILFVVHIDPTVTSSI